MLECLLPEGSEGQREHRNREVGGAGCCRVSCGHRLVTGKVSGEPWLCLISGQLKVPGGREMRHVNVLKRGCLLVLPTLPKNERSGLPWKRDPECACAQ